MTNKVLNIIIAVLAVFIAVFFSMRMVYWGVEINEQDKEMNKTNPAAITYTIEK